jgi:hypothetical protein
VGERLMFPAFIKARPTYKHAAENHRPVWMEGGGGARRRPRNSADPRRDRTAARFSQRPPHLMGKFDERIEEFGLLVGAHETARRVEEIPLDRVIPDPGNPRRSFDDDALAELAASIAARGSCSRSRLRPPTPPACIASVWASGVFVPPSSRAW